MNISELVFKQDLDRKDVAFLLENKDAIRSYVDSLQASKKNTKIKRRWEAMLGKHRSSILRYWLKGIWISDADDDFCTAWTKEVNVAYFTQIKVRVSSEVRVKLKAKKSDLTKAKHLEDFAESYGLTFQQKRKAADDAKKLRGERYKWISVDEYLSSDKSKYLSVFGAEIV